MPRRGECKRRPFIGDVHDAQGMGWLLLEYLDWMRVRHYSEQTIAKQRLGLELFVRWCWERELSRPQAVTRRVLERYQRYLFDHRTKDDQPLAWSTQHTYLIPVRGFFAWLTRQNHLEANPAFDLQMPRLERRLPKAILTAQEADAILNQTEAHTEMGLRDRAILETLYSTAMRRAELAALRVEDLDVERGTVTIRQGKGRKDRVVPIGARALAWIGRYLAEVRPELVTPPDDGTLFVTRLGQSLTLSLLTRLVKGYVEAAHLGKTGACHLFRHTCATLMLENGADIRYIQQLLGHANLETTELYTQVSIRALKAVHTATHPARLERAAPAPPAVIPTLNLSPARLPAESEES